MKTNYLVKLIKHKTKNAKIRNSLIYFQIYTYESIKQMDYISFICIILSQIQILIILYEQIQYFVTKIPLENPGILTTFMHKIDCILNHPTLFNDKSFDNFVPVYIPIRIIYQLAITLWIFIILLNSMFNQQCATHQMGNLIWGFICSIHEKILFLPNFRAGLRIVSNLTNLTESKYNTTLITFYFISYILDIIFALYLAIYGILKIEFDQKASVKSGSIFIINLLYKVCISILLEVYTISKQDSIKWIILMSNMCYSIIILFLLANKWPFNAKSLQKILTTIVFFTFSLCIILLIGCLISTTQEAYLVDQWINYFLWMLFILMFKFVNNYLEKVYNKEVTNPISMLKTEEQFIQRIIFYHEIFCESGKINMNHIAPDYKVLQFQSVMNIIQNKGYFQFKRDLSHYGELYNTIKQYQKVDSKHHFKVLFTLIKLTLNIGLEKFPKSWKLRLCYIQSLFINALYNSNLNLASMYILEVEHLYPDNLEIQAHIMKAKRHIFEVTPNEDSRILDIANYLENIRIVKSVISRIQILTKLHIHFWNVFNTKSYSLLNLLQLVSECNAEYDILYKYLDKEPFLKIRHETIDPKVYLILAMFFLVGRFCKSKYFQALQIYNNLKSTIKKASHTEKLTNENILAKENIAIVISGNKDTLSTIIHATRSIEDQLGYSVNEVKGKDLAVLLPTFYKTRHNNYIINYFEKGIQKVIKATTIKTILTKNQDLKGFYMHVQCNPCLQGGLSYIAIIKPFRPKDDWILLSSEGEIDSMSIKLKNLLKVEVDQLNKALIFDVIEEYDEIHNVLNFFTLISMIKEMEIVDQDMLEKACKRYESTFRPGKLIIVNIEPYQAIKLALRRSNSDSNNFIKEIESLDNYRKLKIWYEKYQLTDTSLKLVNQKKVPSLVDSFIATCTIIDQIYQNHEFVRIINIKRIHKMHLNEYQTINSEDFNKNIEEFKLETNNNEFDIDCGYDDDQFIRLSNLPFRTKNKSDLAEKTLNPKLQLSDLGPKVDLLQVNALTGLLSIKSKKLYSSNREYDIKDLDTSLVNKYLKSSGKRFSQQFNLFHKVLTLDQGTQQIGLVKDEINHLAKERQYTALPTGKLNSGGNDKVMNGGNQEPQGTSGYFKVSINMSSNNAKTPNENRTRYKIQKAFEARYIDKMSKMMVIIILIFGMIAGIMSPYLFYNEIEVDANYLSFTRLLNSSCTVFQTLFSLIYWVNHLKLIKQGYIPNDYWKDLGIINIAKYNKEALLRNQDHYIRALNTFRINSNSYSFSLINEFFAMHAIQNDDVTSDDSNIKNLQNYFQPFFEVAYTIDFTISKIIDDYTFNIDTTLSDANLLIENFNQNYSLAAIHTNDAIIKAIIKEYYKALETDFEYLLSFGIAGLIIIILHTYHIKKYYIFQREFANNLRKMISVKTQMIQQNLQIFYNLIEKDAIERDYHKFTKKIKQIDDIHEEQSEKNKTTSNIIHKKSKNSPSQLTFHRICKRILLTLIYTFSCLIGFIINYAHSKANQIKTELDINRFSIIIERFINTTNSLNLFYSYITYSGTDILYKQKLNKELNELFLAIGDIEDNFKMFVNSDQTFEYNEYFLGNLCNMVNMSSNISCESLAGEAAKSGIFSAENWISANLLKIKNLFEEASNSSDVLFTIFQSDLLYQISNLRLFVVLPAYEALFNSINDQIYQETLTSSVYLNIFIEISVIIYILGLILIIYPMIKYFTWEYAELKDLLKIFPPEIFLRYHYFKLFFIKTSIGVIQNIKYIHI